MKIFEFVNKPSGQYGLNGTPLVPEDLLLIEDEFVSELVVHNEVSGLDGGDPVNNFYGHVTQDELEKLQTIQGDISQRIEITTPLTTWVITHPAGKSTEAFKTDGVRIYGKKTNVSDTVTAFEFTEALTGYVQIN